MSNFSSIDTDDQSGMLVGKEFIQPSDKIKFIKKLINIIQLPTLSITSAMNGENFQYSKLQMIMTVFASVCVDCDLFNLTIVDDNPTTRMIEEIYQHNNFYLCNAVPVRDKKNNNILILIEFYKKATDKPMKFLDVIRQKNAPILGFLYMKELLGLAQKNYKNKFMLATHAKVYLRDNRPDLNSVMRDEAAVALSKLAMDYHDNSMILDNLNQTDDSDILSKNNINYLKNNKYIAYDSRYNYKMTHTEILDSLLEDANIEYIDMGKEEQNAIEMDDNNDDELDMDIDDINGNNSDKEETEEDTDDDLGDLNMDIDDLNKEDNDDDDPNKISRESPYTARQRCNGDIDNPDGKFLKITFKSNPQQIVFMKMPGHKENDRYDRLDAQDEQQIDSINDYINEAVNKLKGTGIQDIFQKIGCPLEVDIKWSERIIKRINDMTAISKSKESMASWYKVNPYMRHIAPMPGRIRIPEAHPTLYVMFDQSGSMSEHEVREINYIIDYFFKKKYSINLFIHDWAQTIDDVKIYEFRSDNSSAINDNYMIQEILNSRVLCGGTSHKGVFDVMEAYIKEVTNHGKKYNIQYCIIASDLESDIEEIWQNYAWPKLLGNNTIAVTNSNHILPFGQTEKVL